MAGERYSLLPFGTRRSNFKRKCCVKSRAALLILLWNFSVSLAFKSVYDTKPLMQSVQSYAAILSLSVVLGVILFFSPIAGLLADIKYGRYKTVVCSSYLMLFLWAIFTLPLIPFLMKYKGTLAFGENVKNILPIFLAWIGIIIALLCSYSVFQTNAILFGMDQLHDLSTEDSILFIHWYVWLYYVSVVSVELTWSLLFYDTFYVDYIDTIRLIGLILTGLNIFAVLLFIFVSLYVMHRQRRWFHIESGRINPYKLIYRVIRFAYKHKTPVYRSAFTYCEDEIPSRLDLGKQKYGGPFTTEQVEDVKAFWGILKVIFSTGPLFMLQVALESTVPIFSQHGNRYFKPPEINSTHWAGHEVHIEGVIRYILISNGLLSPLLIVICLPLYLCVLRPHILCWIPGIFKRIGMGLVLMILSLACYYSMDRFVHVQNDQLRCMFRVYLLHDNHNDSIVNKSFTPPIYQNVYFLTSQLLLSALIDMLVHISIFEFICSQSPHSLKGLLIGTLFSIKSLFQALGISSVVPFATLWSENVKSLSCGSGFYLTYMIVGMVVLLVYICVARKYKYRERDEPSNEYRYAEEYYSNIR